MTASLHLVTAPTLAVVTAAEAKAFARIDVEDQDTLIEALVTTATNMAEQHTQRAFLTQTWRLKLDDFPSEDFIELPMSAPLASVTSVAYTDTSGTSQTLTENTDYIVETDREPGRVSLRSGYTWPSTYDEAGVVTITYVAGWTAAASVPEAIKTFIKLAVTTMWDNPTAIVNGTISTEVAHNFTFGLLDRYVVQRLA